MAVTKQMCKDFRADFQKAVESLERKYGLKITAGTISYSDTGFSFRCTAECAGEDAERKKFEELCVNYGFAPEDYGRKFVVGRTGVTLVGFNPKARKNCCLIKGDDGRDYVCGSEMLRRSMTPEEIKKRDQLLHERYSGFHITVTG